MPNTQLHEQPVTLTEREPAISSKTRGKIHTLERGKPAGRVRVA